MPFCSSCGTQIEAGVRFCSNCGTSISGNFSHNVNVQTATAQALTLKSAPVIQNAIPDTSRLSGARVEKFLVDGERMLFTTERWLNVSGQQRKAHVTNMRLLFYRQEGRLFGLVKNDRLDEIYVTSIRKLKLEEQGLISKTLILQIDEYNIKGNRNDLLGMYRALQSARARSS